jgi:hypothetical protein
MAGSEGREHPREQVGPPVRELPYGGHRHAAEKWETSLLGDPFCASNPGAGAS